MAYARDVGTTVVLREERTCNAARAYDSTIAHSSGSRPFMCAAALLCSDGLDLEERRRTGKCHCGLERSVAGHEQVRPKKDSPFRPTAWDAEEDARIDRAVTALQLGISVMIVLLLTMFG